MPHLTTGSVKRAQEAIRQRQEVEANKQALLAVVGYPPRAARMLLEVTSQENHRFNMKGRELFERFTMTFVFKSSRGRYYRTFYSEDGQRWSQ